MGAVRTKAAVKRRKSSCFHFSIGWSWHCAHWMLTPKKVRATAPARSGGFCVYLRSQLTAPFLLASGADAAGSGLLADRTAARTACRGLALRSPPSLLTPVALTSAYTSLSQGRLSAN